MPRPIRAQVDLAALRHNLHAARIRAAGRRIWAVIKANAYGHGIESAVRGFAAADGLALIDFDEASRARTAGWRGPILMLEGCFDSTDVESCRELDLTTIVHDESQLRMLELAPAGRPIGVHLKVNTGMNWRGSMPRAAGLRCRAACRIRPRCFCILHSTKPGCGLESRSTAQRLTPGTRRASSVCAQRCG
jgi:alanine racemase